MIDRCRACMRRLLADDSGATAVEYSMIAAGIAVAIAATVWALGPQIKGLYERVAAMF